MKTDTSNEEAESHYTKKRAAAVLLRNNIDQPEVTSCQRSLRYPTVRANTRDRPGSNFCSTVCWLWSKKKLTKFGNETCQSNCLSPLSTR